MRHREQSQVWLRRKLRRVEIAEILAIETGSTISFATFQQDLVAATIEQAAGWMYVPFAGRLLIGLPFALSGRSKLAAIGPTTETIRAGSCCVELGGGLLLVAGFQTRIVATALAFHSNFADQNQMIHFLGAGALSIDNRNAKVALTS